MIRFYAPAINTNQCLPQSDSQHCCKVLRMHEGDIVEVVDGAGGLYRCRITVADPRQTLIEILERSDLPPVWPMNITIAVAPTKHMDRMEWLVEKLVEIGVNSIVPLRCSRSERKEIKAERLTKIAISAMKQSLKATLPEIEGMTSLKDFVKNCDASLRYIAYCDDNIERQLLARIYQPGQSVAIMIGPEGDFSPEEVELAFDKGFIPVTLGNNRLRTETAALVACDTFHILTQNN